MCHYKCVQHSTIFIQIPSLIKHQIMIISMHNILIFLEKSTFYKHFSAIWHCKKLIDEFQNLICNYFSTNADSLLSVTSTF